MCLLPAKQSVADADVICLPDGKYFNTRLAAPNVWEIGIDEALVDEAAQIFYDSGSFEKLTQMREPYMDIDSSVGTFFAQRVTWDSNIAWVSVDDRASFDAFESIFSRMQLPAKFAAHVPHSQGLQLYSAFFVVRSWCSGHNWHTDYKAPVNTDALTLITPLRDFREIATFQLAYRAQDNPEGPGTADSTPTRQEGGDDDVRRYVYKKGRAVVFGSDFLHSTEPGQGHGSEVHAYLCFTFGTDQQERWPQIARTLDTQSRVVVHPDGSMRLSKLGAHIQALLDAM